MILNKIKEQAEELINGGNSKEKAEGQGMLNALGELEKYVHAYNLLDEYFDSISDEEKPIVHQKLTDLGMYDPD